MDRQASGKVLFIEGYHQVPNKIKGYVEKGWTVWNAPRPLYGEDWTGDFRHGVFYAAIDPADEYADGFAERNIKLDAYTCHIVSRDEVMEYARKVCADYKISVDQFDYTGWAESYYDSVRE